MFWIIFMKIITLVKVECLVTGECCGGWQYPALLCQFGSVTTHNCGFTAAPNTVLTCHLKAATQNTRLDTVSWPIFPKPAVRGACCSIPVVTRGGGAAAALGAGFIGVAALWSSCRPPPRKWNSIFEPWRRARWKQPVKGTNTVEQSCQSAGRCKAGLHLSRVPNYIILKTVKN